MNFLKKTFLVLGASALLFSACDSDSNDDEKKLGDKEGILLVTFGSSFPDPQITFDNVDKAAKEKFSGEEIRWGFTSDLIINKLRKGNGEESLAGKVIDNNTPEEALKLMIEDGYSKFTVQSLHVIPGEEFDELLEATEKIEKENAGVEFSIGVPLLKTDEDIAAVAKVMAAKFANEVAAGPVLFMGHGTPHEADGQYPKLEAELQKINENFFVGTVEGLGFEAGKTSIGGILAKVNAISPKPSSVTITPLMSIAGDHANNDMNGRTESSDPEEQSWRERLEADGYTVNCIMKGLGDYSEIREIWLEHLEDAKAK
ncbi:sirohydrochlorin cobaltochelatase [Marinifilum sp. RC60d5]|uniref:sirohydrochlorin cobaltochelatase n=1 Tax=Marinifilum sp. RC60d5 TaxID=3458414 RepID=UPI004036A117